MKKLLLFLVFVFITGIYSFGQLSGPKYIPGDYATITAAIAALNPVGVGGGGVTFNIAAGYTETIAATLSITATGTSANPIVFRKDPLTPGANPLITAYVGTLTPGSATQDGIWRLVGSDYVTIDGINLYDPNSTNPATMEYGYGFFKASATDGCRYNTIINCTVTMSRVNNAAGSGPAVEGSKAINVVNSLYTTQTTSITPTSANGTNSYNVFYSNTLQNCNYGIVLSGYAAATPFTLGDQGNDIGGSAAATGNTILNFGGATGAANPAAAIRANNQWGVNISYNNINSNNGSGVNHVNTLRGIYAQAGTSANATINNNNITVKSGAATSALTAIENAIGSTASSNTVNINNNIISGCTYTTATSGTFTGILSSSTAATVNINGNTISNNSVGTSGVASSCSLLGIYQSGSCTNLNMNTNTITNDTIKNQGGTLTCTRAGTSIITYNGNIINSNSIPFSGSTLSCTIYGYYNFVSATVENITNNRIDNLSIAGSSTSTSSYIYGIYTNTVAADAITNSGNILHTLSYANSSTGACSIYGLRHTTGSTINYIKNKIYNLSSSGAGSVVNGIYVGGGTTNNVVNNLIGDLKTPSANAACPLVGIYIAAGTTDNIYYNTVNLNASSTGALFGTAAVYASVTPTLNMRNNIFVNTSAPNGATGFTSSYRRSSNALGTYALTSNNNMFYAGASGTQNLIMYDGTNSYSTLAAYKAAVGPRRDSVSKSEIPNWVSTTGSDATFLHINTGIATGIESGGAVIASYNTDYDGDFRFGHGSYSGTGTAPDMGADEFEGTPLSLCAGTPASCVINGAASVCSGKSTTLTLSNTYTDIGITFQWSSGTDSGGPYDTPLGTSADQSTGPLTVPTYYICRITCSLTGDYFETDEKAVGIDALPTVTADPGTASYCTPVGPAVSITAGGASTYAWSPAAGLDVTTGANVIASPASTTTYTVVGTGGNGCTNTATSVITVGASVTSALATADPSTVCSGSNSQLQASAIQSFNTPQAAAYSFSTASGTSLKDMTGAIPIVAANQDVTSSAITNIGFTFNFGGTNYTQFSASSNGVMGLGSTVITTSDNNNSTTFPTIIPLWDDMHTCTNGNVQYVLNTSGGSGNRILVVEWNYGTYAERAGTFTRTVQVWLYESTNQIKIVYGTNSGSALTSATVGIVSSGTSFNDVNTSTNVNSTSSAQDANTVWPAAGTTYIFTPTGAPVFTYLWAPSTFITGQEALSNPVATAVTTTTPYTVTITGNAGCSATAGATVTVASGVNINSQPVSSAICTGETAVFTVGATGAGLTYQWRKGGDNILIGSNPSAGTYSLTITNATNLDNGIYDVVVSSTCGAPVTSDGTSTLTVKPLPTVTVNPTSAPYCIPGGSAVAITAGGADSYAWSPASGLDVTTGANVNASPSLTTAYTVTGTGGNGCVNTATANIAVVTYPQNVTVDATPNVICSGNTVNLTSSAYAPSSTTVDNYLFSAGTGTTLDPMNGATPVIGSGDDDTPTSSAADIGFTFNYNGTNYTKYSVSPDGWIKLGNSNASSQYDNLTTSATNTPKIYPYWDDLATGTTGNVKTLVTGTAPNRIFIVQWYINIPRNTTGAANSTFQAWLYETTNIIEFRYGTMGVPTGSTNISSGLTGSPSTSYNSITFSSNTSSNSTPDDANNIAPESGTIYTFAPPSEVISYSWTPIADVVTPNNQNTLSNALALTTIFTITTSNSGCIKTANTTVTVSESILITAQPASPVNKCSGEDATFTVGATGANLSYQWRKGGDDILGNPTALTNQLILTGLTDLDNDSYDVVISSTCGVPVTSDPVVLTVYPIPTALASSNAPICAGTSLNFTGGTDIGTTFSWTGPNNFVSIAQNPSINPATTAASGTYYFTATANGCSSVTSSVSVTVNPTPSAVTVTPSSALICPGSIQQLTASGGVVQTNYLTGSGAIALTIPDNDATGVFNTINVSGIAAGATIDSIIVTVNITQTYDGDVELNLVGPNGQIVNLIADKGSNGDNFTNTRISSDVNMPPFTSGSAPFTGTFTADLSNTGLIANIPVTTSTFSDLFTVPDGDWTIRAYDDAGGDVGILEDWAIDIYYKATDVVWSPTDELFTDALATFPYVGGSLTTVYAKPTINRTYTATSTIGSCSSAGSSVLTTSSSVTWTGAVSTAWNVAGNWCGSVPVSTTDILIPNVANLPQIGETTGITNYDAVCRNVTVNAGAQITIHPNSSLTASGNAVLNGSNSIVVKSNINGTGTLITQAGVSGSGTAQIQRHVTPRRWYFISSPIAGGLSSIFMGAWLKDFTESTNSWQYPNPSTVQSLLIGKGFAVWDTTTGGRTFMFNGLPNTGDITPTPAISYSGALNGFNLIGNPYPSAIDWDHPSWVKTNVDATIYAWNNSGNYIKWNGSIGDLVDGIIPADQAFYVHTNAVAPAITIPNASRVLSTQAFYKSLPADLLVLNAVGNGYNDKTFINFNVNATNAFDKEYDGYKLWGIAEAPQLYSYDANAKYSINVLPALSPPLTIPLGFKAGVNGNYSITASELNTFDQNILITLEDVQTSQITDLRQNSVYNFSATSTDDPNRFLVHFGRSTTGIDNTGNNNMNIYSYAGNIYINSNGSEGTVYIYDMLGQQIASERLKPETLNKLTVTATGYYMVKVVTGKNVSLKKVFCII